VYDKKVAIMTMEFSAPFKPKFDLNKGEYLSP
jgi:hypothetical protein